MEEDVQFEENEETSEDESDGSTAGTTANHEESRNQEERNITREDITFLKRDCMNAGVDAAPALDLLENTLFGQEKRLARHKKPRVKTGNEADEDECVKRIDQARKITATNTKDNEKHETGKDPSKSKKRVAGRVQKTNN